MNVNIRDGNIHKIQASLRGVRKGAIILEIENMLIDYRDANRLSEPYYRLIRSPLDNSITQRSLIIPNRKQTTSSGTSILERGGGVRNPSASESRAHRARWILQIKIVSISGMLGSGLAASCMRMLPTSLYCHIKLDNSETRSRNFRMKNSARLKLADKRQSEECKSSRLQRQQARHKKGTFFVSDHSCVRSLHCVEDENNRGGDDDRMQTDAEFILDYNPFNSIFSESSEKHASDLQHQSCYDFSPAILSIKVKARSPPYFKRYIGRGALSLNVLANDLDNRYEPDKRRNSLKRKTSSDVDDQFDGICNQKSPYLESSSTPVVESSMTSKSSNSQNCPSSKAVQVEADESAAQISLGCDSESHCVRESEDRDEVYKIEYNLPISGSGTLVHGQVCLVLRAWLCKK